jgi:hypothetical protein
LYGLLAPAKAITALAISVPALANHTMVARTIRKMEAACFHEETYPLVERSLFSMWQRNDFGIEISLYLLNEKDRSLKHRSLLFRLVEIYCGK